MKYILIPYIALGLILSMAIGVEYSCYGPEMFPTYFGSPFIFKQKSLGSSMEYFFSISGLLLNILIWSFALYILDLGIKKLTKTWKKGNRLIIPYKVIIGIFILFTTMNVDMDYIMLGRGFDEERNYWYWNMDQEAKDWGMSCEGEIVILKR